MRKSLLLAFACASVVAVAQSPDALQKPVDGKELQAPNALRTSTPTDTISDFFAGSLTIYSYPGGGYFVGLNADTPPLTEEAQGYVVIDPYTVEELMIYVGGKADTLTSNDPNSAVTLNIRSLDGANGAPGTILGTQPIPFTDFVDPTDSTVGVTIVDVNPDVYVTFDWAAGFSFNTLSAGDTIGFVSNADGDGQGDGYNWYQINGSWRNFLTDNNTDFDFAVFPIIYQNGVGIEEFSFVEGIKLGLPAPNPAVGSTNIDFELAATANTSLEIFNNMGQKVKTMDLGNLNTGVHQVTVDVNDLAVGTYYYSLVSGANRVTKKLMVQ